MFHEYSTSQVPFSLTEDCAVFLQELYSLFCPLRGKVWPCQTGKINGWGTLCSHLLNHCYSMMVVCLFNEDRTSYMQWVNHAQLTQLRPR